MKRVYLVLTALVLATGVPAVASAHQRATPAERLVILTAVVRQHELSTAQAACQAVTVSSVSPNYALVSWPTKLSNACLKIASNGVVIERLTQGSWHLVTAGSSFSCPIRGVPSAVSRDLDVCA